MPVQILMIEADHQGSVLEEVDEKENVACYRERDRKPYESGDHVARETAQRSEIKPEVMTQMGGKKADQWRSPCRAPRMVNRKTPNVYRRKRT